MRKLITHSAIAAVAVLLSGCFVAENDDADPIVPAAKLAYPLKVGAARVCQDGGSCKKAEIVRLATGGYELRTWNPGEELTTAPTTEPYRLRALKGAGVPADTYLAQSIRESENERTLGLISRRFDGGWEQVSPQCESLRPDAFVAFFNDGWITTGSETLEGMRCDIGRSGLTDSRLYAILSAVQKSSNPTVIYEGS